MSLNIDMKMILLLNCFWTALDHTFFFHKFLNLFEEGECCESLEHFPLEPHRFSINTIQIFQKIFLKRPLHFLYPSFVRVFFLYLPHRAVSLRRRRSWHSRSNEFFHTASLSRSMCNLRNQLLIQHWSLSGSWHFSVSLDNFFKDLQKFLTNREFCSWSWPRWTVAIRAHSTALFFAPRGWHLGSNIGFRRRSGLTFSKCGCGSFQWWGQIGIWCRAWLVIQRAPRRPYLTWRAHRHVWLLQPSKKLSCSVEARFCTSFRTCSQERRPVDEKNTYDCIHPKCQARDQFTGNIPERDGKFVPRKRCFGWRMSGCAGHGDTLQSSRRWESQHRQRTCNPESVPFSSQISASYVSKNARAWGKQTNPVSTVCRPAGHATIPGGTTTAAPYWEHLKKRRTQRRTTRATNQMIVIACVPRADQPTWDLHKPAETTSWYRRKIPDTWPTRGERVLLCTLDLSTLHCARAPPRNLSNRSMVPKMILRLGFVDLVDHIASSIRVQPVALPELSEPSGRAQPEFSYVPLTQCQLLAVCCRGRLHVIVSDKLQSSLLSELQNAPKQSFEDVSKYSCMARSLIRKIAWSFTHAKNTQLVFLFWSFFSLESIHFWLLNSIHSRSDLIDVLNKSL